MFLLICKLYICIQNVFGHIFYSTRLHLYQQVWQFEVQKLAYMLILAAGGMIPYLSSVPPQAPQEELLSAPNLETFFICMLPIVLTYIKNVDADLTTRALFAIHLMA